MQQNWHDYFCIRYKPVIRLNIKPLCVMAGVMLLFAFSMSLVIKIVEKKVMPSEDIDLSPNEVADTTETR